jgi:hypothetical protein
LHPLWTIVRELSSSIVNFDAMYAEIILVLLHLDIAVVPNLTAACPNASLFSSNARNYLLPPTLLVPSRKRSHCIREDAWERRVQTTKGIGAAERVLVEPTKHVCVANAR